MPLVGGYEGCQAGGAASTIGRCGGGGGLSTNPSEWSLNLIANKSGLDGINTAKQVMIEFTLGVAGFMSMIRRI